MQNVFFFGKRHLYAVCEIIFGTAALFAVTIGMFGECNRRWEEVEGGS